MAAELAVERKGGEKWRKNEALLCTAFGVLTVLYAVYTVRQNTDLFFKSQFIHMQFLEELVSGRISASGFFTVFSEHLFPGYNLILAVNYYLFGIWGGFDSVVCAIFLIAAAAIVVWRIWTTSPLSALPKTAACLLSSLLLLSTTNNPQWGMALAAAGGVTIFVLVALFTDDALCGGRLSPWIFLAIPVMQILFLGGYAIGSDAAIGGLLVIDSVQRGRISRSSLLIGAAIALSTAAYVVLVTHYSVLWTNKPTEFGANIGSIAAFAVVMTGASVLGKALFEQTHTLIPYYALGGAFMAMTLVVWVQLVRRPVRGGMFILALSIYSAVNILTVSVFRYRNGTDGAMGQWYNVHTHFIAVAIGVYLCSNINSRSSVKRGFAFAAIVLIAAASLRGYLADWRKAPYAKEYKQQFAAQAPVILAFPETIKDKTDPFQTMLWYYQVVKPAIDFMYAHKLWIFKGPYPLVNGTTRDGWMELGKPVTVMCPAASQDVRFHAWRTEGLPESRVRLRVGGHVKDMQIQNGMMDVPLDGAAGIMLDGFDAEASSPIRAHGDLRLLIAKLADFTCVGTR